MELRDGKVRIQASDDVRVAQVKVTILDEQGAVAAQGLAVQAQPTWWDFAPAPPLGGRCKVVVEAQDLAGNVTRQEQGVG